MSGEREGEKGKEHEEAMSNTVIGNTHTVSTVQTCMHTIHVHVDTPTSLWSWSTMGTPLISRISSPGLRGLATRLRGSLQDTHTGHENILLCRITTP